MRPPLVLSGCSPAACIRPGARPAAYRNRSAARRAAKLRLRRGSAARCSPRPCRSPRHPARTDRRASGTSRYSSPPAPGLPLPEGAPASNRPPAPSMSCLLSISVDFSRQGKHGRTRRQHSRYGRGPIPGGTGRACTLRQRRSPSAHRPGPGLSLLPPSRVFYSASALSSARMMFREMPIETSWMIPMMSSA